MKFIWGKVWLIWSAFAFLLTWPFVSIAYFITYRLQGGEQKYNRGFSITKLWGKVVLILLGIRLKKLGNFKQFKTGQYVFVSNHRSQIDIPINFSSHPQLFVILSKVEATKIPVVGTNLKHAHVTVNRKQSESRKQAIAQMDKHLEAGRSILLYPEGRRNKTDSHLSKFKAGAFLLAIKHQLPIVPVTIINSDKINNPKNPLAVYPGTVQVIFNDPISTEGFSTENLHMLIETTRKTMLSNFKKYDVK